MERPDGPDNQQDTSFLRLMLIHDIIQADDATLYAMATVLQRLGLLDLATEDAGLDTDIPAMPPPRRCHLRLVQ